jgi:hypothetical protein
MGSDFPSFHKNFPFRGLVGVSQASDKSRFAALFSNKKSKFFFILRFFRDVLDFVFPFMSLSLVKKVINFG